MSQQRQTVKRSWHLVAYGVAAAAGLLFAASPAHAQWAAKPAPLLPQPVIDQAWQGSVVLGLVFESNGQVRDVQIVRSSGIDGLDKIAREGAMKWRLDAASIQPSDLTVGRRHMIKFYQKANVKTVVAPARAFWREL